MMPDDGHETGKVARRDALRAVAGTVGVGSVALAGVLMGAQVSPAAAADVPGQEIVGS